MKKVLLALTISGFTLGMATSAIAQATPPAPAAGSGNAALMAGTGLTTGAAVGLLAVAVVLGIALGGDDNVATTTTTTNGTN